MVFKYGNCRECGRKNQIVPKPRKCLCGGTFTLSDNWYVRWTHQGKVHVKVVSSRKVEAEAYEAEIKRSIKTKALLPHEEVEISFEKAKEGVEKWFDLALVEMSTINMYRSCLRRLAPLLENKSLQDLTMQEVINYQSARLKSVKPATVNRELATLKRVYALHCEWVSAKNAPRLHATNSDLLKIKLLPEDNLKTACWTEEECKKLLDACHNERIKMIIYTALMTGLRLSAILSLRWDQIADDAITLEASQMKSKRKVSIPLHPKLKTALRRYKVASGYREWVFKEADTNIQSTFYDMWYKVLDKANMKHVVFHESRHTFASHFLRNGGDIATLSELMDHSNLNITKARYAHLDQGHKLEKVTKFAMEV